MSDHERQGTGYDPGASRHELQGRQSAPPPVQVDLFPAAPSEVIAQLRAQVDKLVPAGRDAFPGICGTMSTNGGPDVASGLYSEEATLKCVRAVFTRMLDAAEGVELYRPSNGTEGEIFMSKWCEKCTKDNFDHDTGEGGCDIIVYAMAGDIDDPDYPRAWRQDGDQGPRCTEFEAIDASKKETA